MDVVRTVVPGALLLDPTVADTSGTAVPVPDDAAGAAGAGTCCCTGALAAGGAQAAEWRGLPQGSYEVAQAADPRVYQLEEQVRSLNGKVEELTFQLLELQEQLRRNQEDNEFRFQQLEGSGQPMDGGSSTSGDAGDLAAPGATETADAAPQAAPAPGESPR